MKGGTLQRREGGSNGNMSSVWILRLQGEDMRQVREPHGVREVPSLEEREVPMFSAKVPDHEEGLTWHASGTMSSIAVGAVG